MRAGACQIVSLPLCPKDFKAALDRIALHYVYALRETKVIAVAGVTGGCGATTLAINLACEIAHLHKLRCVLVDLSLKMGVIATHLNLQPTSSILDLLRDVRRVDTVLLQRVLVPVMDHCSLLPGPDGIAGDVTVSLENIGHLLDTLKQITDVIVLDVPCTYDELYFEAIAGAGQAVLIGEQTLPSIRALKLVHDAIGRNPRRRDHLVVNRYEPKKKGFHVENLLKPLEVSSLMTVVRDDEAMSRALGHGCTLRLALARSPALSDIGALADLLLDRNAQPPAKPLGLFGRLGRALTQA
jgi:pilus assembly protein CpaE